MRYLPSYLLPGLKLLLLLPMEVASIAPAVQGIWVVLHPYRTIYQWIHTISAKHIVQPGNRSKTCPS